MKRPRYLLNILIRKVPQHPVLHISTIASIDKQYVSRPIPKLTFSVRSRLLILRQKPNTSRNLRIRKQLPRQRHHTLHQIIH